MDVVLLGAGEVLEGRPPRLGRHHPDIHLELRVGQDGGLGRPSEQDLLDQRQGRQVVEDGVGVVRGDQQVDVPDGLLAAADAARWLHFLDGGMLAQQIGQSVRKRPCDEERKAQGALGDAAGLLEHLLLGTLAHAGQVAQVMGLRLTDELGDALDLETFRDELGALGAEARHLAEGDRSDGHFTLEFAQVLALAVLEEIRDLAGDRLADPMDFLEAPLLPVVGDVIAHGPDGASSRLVGADPEAIAALQFQQACNPEQQGSHFGVAHRKTLPRPSCGRRRV
ncbi:hypothetical protein D3C86_1352810 [compost metagenome]